MRWAGIFVSFIVPLLFHYRDAICILAVDRGKMKRKNEQPDHNLNACKPNYPFMLSKSGWGDLNSRPPAPEVRGSIAVSVIFTTISNCTCWTCFYNTFRFTSKFFYPFRCLYLQICHQGVTRLSPSQIFRINPWPLYSKIPENSMSTR